MDLSLALLQSLLVVLFFDMLRYIIFKFIFYLFTNLCQDLFIYFLFPDLLLDYFFDLFPDLFLLASSLIFWLDLLLKWFVFFSFVGVFALEDFLKFVSKPCSWVRWWICFLLCIVNFTELLNCIVCWVCLWTYLNFFLNVLIYLFLGFFFEYVSEFLFEFVHVFFWDLFLNLFLYLYLVLF